MGREVELKEVEVALKRLCHMLPSSLAEANLDPRTAHMATSKEEDNKERARRIEEDSRTHHPNLMTVPRTGGLSRSIRHNHDHHLHYLSAHRQKRKQATYGVWGPSVSVLSRGVSDGASQGVSGWHV
ncbi:uncharacterized protein PAC_14219 [Phialocephala subalpina]|uniref:Uncharacterized protein n=1 Tax=Phialocephala subalpina TaxID=576137 RepID=A0A1L7XH19_9HELO|nr:uncharacterized protein PAC_14219 [Phialocephala subalpina]